MVYCERVCLIHKADREIPAGLNILNVRHMRYKIPEFQDWDTIQHQNKNKKNN